MLIDLETIITQAVREAVADHLEKHPLSIPATVGAATTPDTQDEGPRYYTRQEAAAVAKISLPTLHQLHNEGRIDFVKVGRSTRILADKFDADLAAGKFSNLRKRNRA
jgi:excisionase family DNA binding protein